MPIDPNQELISELRRISALLALNLTKGQPQREQILILDGIGFQANEIADILDTTSNTVYVTLSTSRRKRKGRIRSRKNHEGETS